MNLTSSDNSTNPRVGHQITKKQGLDNDSFSTIMKRTIITKVWWCQLIQSNLLNNFKLC